MVFVQVLVFGRVQDNRVRSKRAVAAKLEREKTRKEKLRALEEERASISNSSGDSLVNGNGTANGTPLKESLKSSVAGMDGVWDMLEECPPITNGTASKRVPETESEASLTETSEEEMFI